MRLSSAKTKSQSNFLLIRFMLLSSFFYVQSCCDAAESWQLGLQDPATPIMESMLNFHNYLMLFLIAIGFFVTWMLVQVFRLFNENLNRAPLKFTHSSLLEIIWTIFPAFVLLLIAVPSFALLYSLDELIDPSVTIKIIGHQWYWSYEISDFLSLNGESLLFDSYMTATNDLTRGAFRLLEVDQRVVLPVDTHIRLLVTAADVLHSWAVPSFGIKIDACPGRLSQGSLFIKREGVYYGQCSEICGTNHGFMPIVVKGVLVDDFVSWVLIKIEDVECLNISV
jgi:cytochrome c oxidase subunit 2